ncbi:MLO-like protein 10 isoform X2 [Amaranthus tricolor]|uniref:MLO-like protein 10 isoform X2 n=1 Tax=Amaranthus tricolor TaxID=29722 RepID=UPI00258DC88F|nr:MLO-like protein 10 isoform X2 [Amaranthus tricolor]
MEEENRHGHGHGHGNGGRKLSQTPTWSVAGVCAFIILISFLLEKALQSIGKWLTNKQKRALYEALDKIKEELMVMGFISLILTFSQGYITRICIPSRLADHMLPCETENGVSNNVHRRLTFEGVDHKCHEIRSWKDWELECSSLEYELRNDPSRFRLTRQTTFVRTHDSFWTRNPFFSCVRCFFRQFFKSVSKADYITLRHGFLNSHIAPGNQFDFQQYIKRSLEDDFKVIVGVSPLLWASFVIFLLLNVKGWRALFSASMLSLVVVLAVGTKLQTILTRMALKITDKHSVIQGIPLVQGSDEYFWFSNPQFILHLLHFTLFQNAFQITYFLWILYEFGLQSCFHHERIYMMIKIPIGIVTMVLCSYSTLPLYALVTQMGSRMKKSVFDEQTSKELEKSHTTIMKNQGQKTEKNPSSRTLGGNPNSFSKSLKHHSSGPILHRFLSAGHSSHSTDYVKLQVPDVENDEIIRVVDNLGNTEMTVLPTLDEYR